MEIAVRSFDREKIVKDAQISLLGVAAQFYWANISVDHRLFTSDLTFIALFDVCRSCSRQSQVEDAHLAAQQERKRREAGRDNIHIIKLAEEFRPGLKPCPSRDALREKLNADFNLQISAAEFSWINTIAEACDLVVDRLQHRHFKDCLVEGGLMEEGDSLEKVMPFAKEHMDRLAAREIVLNLLLELFGFETEISQDVEPDLQRVLEGINAKTALQIMSELREFWMLAEIATIAKFQL